MSKKSISIAIIAIIILAIGVGVWRWEKTRKNEEVKRAEEQKVAEQKKQEEQNKKNENVTKEEAIDLGDWKLYRNYEYGFEVKYPNEWKLRIADDIGYDEFKSYFFEKDKYTYFAIFPTGAFGQGIQEPKITYEKFKGRDAKMFWYDSPYPNFIYVIKDYSQKWNENNRIELRGSGENIKILEEMYNDFQFIK